MAGAGSGCAHGSHCSGHARGAGSGRCGDYAMCRATTQSHCQHSEHRAAGLPGTGRCCLLWAAYDSAPRQRSVSGGADLTGAFRYIAGVQGAQRVWPARTGRERYTAVQMTSFGRYANNATGVLPTAEQTNDSRVALLPLTAGDLWVDRAAVIVPQLYPNAAGHHPVA